MKHLDVPYDTLQSVSSTEVLPPNIVLVRLRDPHVNVHSGNSPPTSYVAAMSASRRVSATLVHRSVGVGGSSVCARVRGLLLSA